MKTTASVARRFHRSTNPGFWAHSEQRRKERAEKRNLSPRLKGGVPETINAGKKKREPHKSEVRALGAAACRLKSVDKKDTRYKARAQKTAHPTKMRCATWERQLAAVFSFQKRCTRPKERRKAQDFCGFFAISTFDFYDFPKKMWKTRWSF